MYDKFINIFIEKILFLIDQRSYLFKKTFRETIFILVNVFYTCILYVYYIFYIKNLYENV